ncbi:hypothetical protein GE061_000254 [Apolygus lucorum]|uniref:Uncharacterized protein n=1 Tax=Apolygus lucorum TaxID=248454 RepID=A0A6A4KD51_APOLU|nr:hypothetical protein GE061_000254 [Apolygus lucorum]
MDEKLKIALVAKLHGAQFVCSHCRKVFVSEKHLRHHEDRRHSGDASHIQPTRRIQDLVEFLDSSRTEVEQQGDKKHHRNTVEGRQESPRSRLSRLMNNTLDPFVSGKQSIKTRYERTEPQKDEQLRVSGLVVTEGTSKEDTSVVNTIQASGTRSNDELCMENTDSAVWELEEWAKHNSGAHTTQSDGDDLSRKISLERPFRSKLLGPLKSEDLFLTEETNDSWLFRDDSDSEDTSTSEEDFDVAQRSASDAFVGDSIEDLKMPSWEEIEEGVLNENSGKTEVVMNLEAQLMRLGIDPNSPGISNKLMERSRLTLHANRAGIMKENENFKDLLDHLRGVIHDRAMQTLYEPASKSQ